MNADGADLRGESGSLTVSTAVSPGISVLQYYLIKWLASGERLSTGRRAATLIDRAQNRKARLKRLA